jgi:hypothetical protein
MKARICRDPNPERYVVFFCPGCRDPHVIPTLGKMGWKWNESCESPTFEPSILVHDGAVRKAVCHSFVKNGRIEFLPDCTHALKGMTVDLPPVEAKWA